MEKTRRTSCSHFAGQSRAQWRLQNRSSCRSQAAEILPPKPVPPKPVVPPSAKWQSQKWYEHTKSHQEKLCCALGHGNSTAWQFSEKQPRFQQIPCVRTMLHFNDALQSYHFEDPLKSNACLAETLSILWKLAESCCVCRLHSTTESGPRGPMAFLSECFLSKARPVWKNPSPLQTEVDNWLGLNSSASIQIYTVCRFPLASNPLIATKHQTNLPNHLWGASFDIATVLNCTADPRSFCITTHHQPLWLQLRRRLDQSDLRPALQIASRWNPPSSCLGFWKLMWAHRKISSRVPIKEKPTWGNDWWKLTEHLERRSTL